MQCPDEESLLSVLSGEPAFAADRAPLLAHIESCDSCRQLVSELLGPAAGELDEQHRTLDPGARVGDRYTIVRFLARGGMGEVYRAHDELLDEDVALKTIVLSRLDDARAYARFKSEVQLARKVTHPNVCRILEFGLHRQDRKGGGHERVPFLTMEFLEGRPLSQRIREEGPFSPEQALPVVRDMIAGLDAIHAAGIVHRDLKSDNVFLCEGGGRLQVKLMDFGLARPLVSERVRSYSSPSTIVGTPLYMAPEQVEGSAVTSAADIYSLGVIMFEMLAGRLPFDGETAMGVATRKLITPAPSLAELVPKLPTVWVDAVSRCLERAPADRFAGPADVLAALDGVPSAKDTTTRRTWRWIPVVAATLVIGLAAFAFGTRPQPVGAAAPFKPVTAMPRPKPQHPEPPAMVVKDARETAPEPVPTQSPAVEEVQDARARSGVARPATRKRRARQKPRADTASVAAPTPTSNQQPGPRPAVNPDDIFNPYQK